MLGEGERSLGGVLNLRHTLLMDRIQTGCLRDLFRTTGPILDRRYNSGRSAQII